jgi:hypothetical protein
MPRIPELVVSNLGNVELGGSIETNPLNGTPEGELLRGLDRASSDGARIPTPDLPDSIVAGAGGHPQLAGLAPIRKSTFALIEGRYPECVSFDVLLQQMGNNEQAKQAVKKVIGAVQAQTGMVIPEALVNAALANPARLADILSVTPAQLSQGASAIVEAHRQGAIKDAAPKSRILPQHFDLANLAAVPYVRGETKLKELVPGLYQGDVKSDLPDAQAKANTVLAEIFDRLAENPSLAAKDRFSVRHKGHEHRTLNNFVRSLGTVDGWFQHRAANFADFKTKAPNGAILDVPASLMIKGEGGIAFPAAHAELIISVQDPAISGEIKFYQGMNSTGFFAKDVWKVPRWLGMQVSPEKLRGADAAEAIELAGHLSDTINKTAKDLGLPFSGYGVLGVCMDSVAVVRHAMTGKIDYWPLVMRDELLMPQVAARLNDKRKSDDDEFGKILKSIQAAPSDAVANETARARMLASIPWSEGQEPFQSVVDARRALQQD